MISLVKSFLRNESGATAIEYGLIAGLISVTIITAAVGIGGGVQSRFTQVQTAVD